MADRSVPPVRGGRSPVMARSGLVAASQPLAAQAGLQVMQNGGNAIDGALAAAITLCVVEPMSNGLGGDLFAIVHPGADGGLAGLNASGPAPAAASREAVQALELDAMPDHGGLTVTVPGMIDGWWRLHQRYGEYPWEGLFAPATRYATDGFPVSPIIARSWSRASGVLREQAGDGQGEFLPGGRAPAAGTVFHHPGLADTLAALAQAGPAAFYQGELADRVAAVVQQRGGFLAADDLAAFRSEWVTPIGTRYRDVTVWELPPNGQGLAVLQMLNILEGFPLAAWPHNGVRHLHTLIEAKRLVFVDRNLLYGDPAQLPVPVERLVAKEYGERRRSLIQPDRALATVEPGFSLTGDTVYLTAADAEGNAVSLIQSLFGSFGSGLVVPGTGIVLQNRGSSFRLTPHHPNALAPGRRPLHTIIPGFATRDGRPWLSFGVMGGDNQPQGQVQVLVNMVDYGMDVQAAGEADRFRHTGGVTYLESGIPPATVQGLLERGHDVRPGVNMWGGYQGICIDTARGVLSGGSDPRKDGCAVGW